MAIALLTDFGTRDYFVAVMKGVILSINPRAVIIDITHEISPQDVETGAFVLKTAYRWFPPGTIFVAVVDPGVGTERAPLLLKTRRYFFIGPDNGLLTPAAEEDKIEEAYYITYRLPNTSKTFHGRDIFAPTAALLSLGVSPQALGTPTRQWTRPVSPHMATRVIYVDRFGNVYTNVTREPASLGETLCIKTPTGVIKARHVQTYGQAAPGETITLINSEGYLEIAVAMGNAAAAYSLKPGIEIKIEKC
ncbi:MAG: S-adenosyl-l-methionine hydroxide adenosyltransferase family protein [Pyrobaculum sp.]